MCACVCGGVSDRDGPSEGTDGDNNRGKRGRMDGEKVCVEQSALKAKFIKVYLDTC